MDDDEFMAQLEGALDENEWIEKWGWKIRTFEDAGVLTKNLGLVITDADGKEHQIALLGSFRRD